MIDKKKPSKNKEKIRLTRPETINSVLIAIAALLAAATYITWYTRGGITASNTPENLNQLFASYFPGVLPFAVLSGVFLFGLVRLIRGRVRPEYYRTILIAMITLGMTLGVFLFVYLDMAAFFSSDSGKTIFSF